MDKTTVGVLILLWAAYFYLLDIGHVRARTMALVARSNVMAILMRYPDTCAVIASVTAWFWTITLFVLLGIWSGNDMSRVAGEITTIGNIMGMAIALHVWSRVRWELSATR